VVDKSPASGTRAGEILSPQCSEILQDLGLTQAFASQNHKASPGILSVWGSSEIKSNDNIFSAHGAGWHLDRRKFNALLVDAAKNAGAELILEARVKNCVERCQNWLLTVGHQGEFQRLGCRFVIDAGGRTSRCVVNYSRRFIYDRLIAVSVLCSPSADRTFSAYALVEAIDEGWFYSAPLPEGQDIVVYMTDADLFAHGCTNSRMFLRDQIKKTVWTQGRLGDRCSDPTICSAVSSVREVVVGRNWLAAGDASQSFDPLSSQGILKAIKAGLEAASVGHELLMGHIECAAEYETRNRRTFAKYLSVYRFVYGLEMRWQGLKFWARRQGQFLSPLGRETSRRP
jgi:flavin-dependent dehydrogenase